MSANLPPYQAFYIEQDSSLKNAKSQTTKDFRFRTPYLEKVDSKIRFVLGGNMDPRSNS